MINSKPYYFIGFLSCHESYNIQFNDLELASFLSWFILMTFIHIIMFSLKVVLALINDFSLCFYFEAYIVHCEVCLATCCYWVRTTLAICFSLSKAKVGHWVLNIFNVNCFILQFNSSVGFTLSCRIIFYENRCLF